MTAIPLGIFDHVRPYAGRPPILTWNAFFEADPSNLQNQTAMIRRPAVRELLTVGDGPIRKIYYRRDLFNNDFFVVSAANLYRVSRTGPATFSDVMITGDLDETSEPWMVASGENLFITDQSALYVTDGVTALAEITTPDDVSIRKLLYIGGYIICVVKDSQRFYWINPGEITIDPLNFAEAEGAPDQIADAIVLGDQLYFYGENTTEIWYLSGDLTAPFQRVQGKLMETGVVDGTACVIPNQDIIFLIGSDGTARVGSSMQKVSNAGIEGRIRTAIRAKNLADL